MIAHHKGRDKALEPLGWTGRWAEWIALACLHGGVISRGRSGRAFWVATVSRCAAPTMPSSRKAWPSTRWGDSSLWSIDPDPRVDLTRSERGPAHEFFRVRDVRQRPDGPVVVADRGSQEVRLYSSQGEFLGSVGGAGDGPGEFRNLWKVEPSADQILALDQRGRVAVFTPDLAPMRTFDVAARASDLHDLHDGTVLVEVYSFTETEPGTEVIRIPGALLRYDLAGARIDSLGETAGFEEVSRVINDRYIGGSPLFRRDGHLAANDDVILEGSADLMEVRELSVTGDVVRILRIPDYPAEPDR